MKAVDEGATMRRVKPRTVRTLMTPDIRIEFLHCGFDLLSVPRWRKRQEKRIRVHSVRHRVDHSPIAEWPVGGGYGIFIFLHHLDVFFEETENALDDRRIRGVLRHLREADKG